MGKLTIRPAESCGVAQGSGPRSVRRSEKSVLLTACENSERITPSVKHVKWSQSHTCLSITFAHLLSKVFLTGEGRVAVRSRARIRRQRTSPQAAAPGRPGLPQRPGGTLRPLFWARALSCPLKGAEELANRGQRAGLAPGFDPSWAARVDLWTPRGTCKQLTNDRGENPAPPGFGARP